MLSDQMTDNLSNRVECGVVWRDGHFGRLRPPRSRSFVRCTRLAELLSDGVLGDPYFRSMITIYLLLVSLLGLGAATNPSTQSNDPGPTAYEIQQGTGTGN